MFIFLKRRLNVSYLRSYRLFILRKEEEKNGSLVYLKDNHKFLNTHFASFRFFFLFSFLLFYFLLIYITLYYITPFYREKTFNFSS